MTQQEYNTTQDDNTSIRRPNTSTKEAWAAKIGLYFTFFVTELYISLISFRNGWYSPNIASNLWIPRPICTSFRDTTKQTRTYDVLRKDCNSDNKDAYLPHSSLAFYQLRLRLLTLPKSRLNLGKFFYLLGILPTYEEPLNL